MRPVYIDVLHIFVIVMLSGFVIFSVFAASGNYDHWTTRFVRHFRFKRRGKLPADKREQPPLN